MENLVMRRRLLFLKQNRSAFRGEPKEEVRLNKINKRDSEERHKGSDDLGPIGHAEKFRLYSKQSGQLLKQRIWFSFHANQSS